MRVDAGLAGLLLAGFLATGAQATPLRIEAIGRPKGLPHMAYAPSIQSVKDGSVAALMIVTPQFDSGERPIIVLRVQNRGSSAFEVHAADVSVVTDKGRSVPILTHAALVAGKPPSDEPGRNKEGFVDGVVGPRGDHITELGLGQLAADVTGLTLTVTLGTDVHTLPLAVSKVALTASP